MSDNGYTEEQLEFIHKLEQLADYAGQQADDESRTLIAELQDEFVSMKRGAARAGVRKDARLNVQDVFDFGTEIGQDFPKAQKGCEVLALVYFGEQQGNAPNN
jgi:hypothetical protein